MRSMFAMQSAFLQRSGEMAAAVTTASSYDETTPIHYLETRASSAAKILCFRLPSVLEKVRPTNFLDLAN